MSLPLKHLPQGWTNSSYSKDVVEGREVGAREMGGEKAYRKRLGQGSRDNRP